MKYNASLKQAYDEQMELYPRISQEEIVAIYDSEGITTEKTDEVISKLKRLVAVKTDKLSSMKMGSDYNQSDDNTFSYDEDTIRINNLKRYVNGLEQKAKELQDLHKEMLKLLPSQEQSDDNIDATIKKLNNEIANRKKEIDEEKRKQDAINDIKCTQKIGDLEKELKDLTNKVEKLERKYKNNVHKLYISTRGIVPRDRAFPSIEARNKIVCGTLGLAKYWARVYYYNSERVVSLDELNQVAYEGLLSAAHYYIPSDRATFSTYARKCIGNKLKHELYNRKEMKKRPYKPTKFFEKEKDRIKYIQMFLEAIKIKSRSGKTRYYSETKEVPVSVMLFRLKEDILSFNREMKFREESHRMIRSFGGKRTQEKLDEIIQIITTIINESKISTLISNDQREIASLVVNHENRPQGLQEIYELLYFLNSYSYKLDLIEKYFLIEQRLMLKNDGITPTDDEVLKELNQEIKKDNQERYKLRKAGFFDKQKPYYKWYYDYYTEYRDMYKVDPFVSPDDYESSEYSSKKKEKDDIAYDFEEDDRLYELDNMIEGIEDCDSEEVFLYFANDAAQVYDSFDEVYEDEEYDSNKGCIFSREEAIERLKIIRESIPNLNEEEYVKTVLQERKDTVNAILKKKNAPLIEQNREIKKQREQYDLGKKYQRHLTGNDVLGIRKDTELLFGNDDELLILMNSGRSKDRRYCNLSVEEEALNNVFLEEYYKLLEQLPELERQVILKYFDANGSRNMTAREVGNDLGISESKVNKTKTKALKRLSANTRLQHYNEER